MKACRRCTGGLRSERPTTLQQLEAQRRPPVRSRQWERLPRRTSAAEAAKAPSCCADFRRLRSEPFVCGANARREVHRGGPTESAHSLDVQQFPGGTVRFGRVPLKVTLVT